MTVQNVDVDSPTVTSEPDVQVVEQESDVQVVEQESDLQAVEQESDLQAVEQESDLQVVEQESDLQVVEPTDDPQVVDPAPDPLDPLLDAVRERLGADDLDPAEVEEMIGEARGSLDPQPLSWACRLMTDSRLLQWEECVKVAKAADYVSPLPAHRVRTTAEQGPRSDSP